MEFSSHNTGVGSLPLLQGIFPTWGSNPGLPHCRQNLYQLSHQGRPRILAWVAYRFSRGSSQTRNRTGVSCIGGRFFTNRAESCSAVSHPGNPPWQRHNTKPPITRSVHMPSPWGPLTSMLCIKLHPLPFCLLFLIPGNCDSALHFHKFVISSMLHK